jgi:hypothetical protein
MTSVTENRIAPEALAEQYYYLLQKLIGKLQDRFRNTPGLTQKTIAQKTGKQEAVVSRCLAGQENMTLRTMHDLARGMDCRLDIELTPLAKIVPANRPIAQRTPTFAMPSLPTVIIETRANTANASTTIDVRVGAA